MNQRQFGWESSQEDGYWRKGPWTAQEDNLLIEYINIHDEGRWNSVSKITGLRRSGKSCRLRWVNYLRPGLKRGKITPEEETLILQLHALWGNRWSTIARNLPGRTDNEIKNYWRTHFKKKNPSKKVERTRARFLLQKQEMKNELQQKEVEDEEQKLQTIDMTAEDIDHQTTTLVLQQQDILQVDMECSLNPHAYLLQGSGSCGSVVSSKVTGASFSGAGGVGYWVEEDCGSWGSLWNLDA